MVIIFGPTGVGKTEYALWLADQLPSAIVNMDMGQMYTPLSIGTAKPDWRSSSVPHYLFDHIDEPVDFSVTSYRAHVQERVHKLWQQQRLPILVGGSGFYLKSLFFPPEDAEHAHDVSEINAHYADYSDIKLWQRLEQIDPERAARIHKHDRYRVQRALTLWHTTGKKPSQLKPSFQPISSATIIFLTRDRNKLYARIDARVLAMLKQGWQEEVDTVRTTAWETFLQRKGLIGYPALLSYRSGIQTKQALTTAIDRIQQRTRNYAKRQTAFWSMLRREFLRVGMVEIGKNIDDMCDAQRLCQQSTITTINLTLPDSNQYSIQLLHRLQKLFTGLET